MIQNLILDLGGVLLKTNYEAVGNNFRALGMEGLRDVFFAPEPATGHDGKGRGAPACILPAEGPDAAGSAAADRCARAGRGAGSAGPARLTRIAFRRKHATRSDLRTCHIGVVQTRRTLAHAMLAGTHFALRPVTASRACTVRAGSRGAVVSLPPRRCGRRGCGAIRRRTCWNAARRR